MHMFNTEPTCLDLKDSNHHVNSVQHELYMQGLKDLLLLLAWSCPGEDRDVCSVVSCKPQTQEEVSGHFND